MLYKIHSSTYQVNNISAPFCTPLATESHQPNRSIVRFFFQNTFFCSKTYENCINSDVQFMKIHILYTCCTFERHTIGMQNMKILDFSESVPNLSKQKFNVKLIRLNSIKYAFGSKTCEKHSKSNDQYMQIRILCICSTWVRQISDMRKLKVLWLELACMHEISYTGAN